MKQMQWRLVVFMSLLSDIKYLLRRLIRLDFSAARLWLPAVYYSARLLWLSRNDKELTWVKCDENDKILY